MRDPAPNLSTECHAGCDGMRDPVGYLHRGEWLTFCEPACLCLFLRKLNLWPNPGIRSDYERLGDNDGGGVTA